VALGRLLEDGDRRTVRFERRLEASVEEVWDALVDPERLRRWLAEASVDAREGGSVELRFTDETGGRVSGTIRVFDPPRTLEYEWRFEGERDSVVRFELRASDGGTELTLVHRRLGADAAAGYSAGWHAHLDLLAEALAGDVRTDWQERFEALLPAYVSG
jgi:uncharacterized protein YndB with AHSA1/START domain